MTPKVGLGQALGRRKEEKLDAEGQPAPLPGSPGRRVRQRLEYHQGPGQLPDEEDDEELDIEWTVDEAGEPYWWYYHMQVTKTARQGETDPDRTSWRRGERKPHSAWQDPPAKSRCGDGPSGNTRSKAPLRYEGDWVAPYARPDSDEGDDEGDEGDDE